MLNYCALNDQLLGSLSDLREHWAEESGQNLDLLYDGWRNRYVMYLRDKRSRGEGEVFAACDGDAVVGSVLVQIADSYRAAVFGTVTAKVNALYVEPTFRNQGVAKRLMDLALQWAREKGCSGVRLHSSGEAESFYRKLGFVTGSELEMEF